MSARSTKSRRKKVTTPVIETREQAELAMELYRDRTIKLEEQQWLLEKAKLEADQRHAGMIDALNKELKSIAEQLKCWAEANKGDLFAKRKTLSMRHGELGWRTGTLKVIKLVKAALKKLIPAVKEVDESFIRKTEDVDKEAIIKAFKAGQVDVDALRKAGLKVGREEAFFVEPKIEEGAAS